MREWIERNRKLSKEFTFTNFSEAVEFINYVAKLAEEMDHHPDILLHDYKQVLVSTTTHSAGSVVTDKDRAISEEINRIYLDF